MADYSLPIYDDNISADEFGYGGAYYQSPVDAEELRQRQLQSLTEHKQYAENLQGLQDQVKLRGEDLDISKQLLQATSPGVPKGAREFLLRGISKSVGVDDKGDYANSLIKMLSGLDPQSLEHVRRTFGSDIPGADPGQIKAQVRGVMTGQIKVSDLLTRVAATVPPPEPTSKASPPASTPGTGEPPPPRRVPATPTPAEEAIGNQRRLPTVGETAPRDQPTDPGLMHELGLDPTQKARNDDVIRRYPGIPMDPEGQRKLRNDLQTQSAAAANAVTGAVNLHNLFRGRPETIGITGSIVRTLDETVDQLNGLARAAGAVVGGAASEFDMKSPVIQGLLKSTVERISKFYDATGLEKTAVDSARIQSQVLQMAYDMALARGIPGNRLTNGIIGQQLQTLGKSASKEQFEGVLKDLVDRNLGQSAQEMGAKLGSPDYYPSAASLPDEDLKKMVQYSLDVQKDGQPDVIPDRYKANLIKEMEYRVKVGEAADRGGETPTRGERIPLQSPTIEEEEQARRQTLIRDEMRKRQELETKIAGEERAQQTAERAQRNETRKFDMEQARQLENDRRYELAVQREKRQEQFQRQRMIMQAFQHLGASIAGAIKSPGGGVQGISAPEQDSRAFQMQGPPQRRAPTPIDASRFQRGQR